MKPVLYGRSRQELAEYALRRAGFDDARIVAFAGATPRVSGGLDKDFAAFAAFWRVADEIVASLPPIRARAEAEYAAAEAVKEAARAARRTFLRAHAGPIYARLTDGMGRFVRAERLVYDAARTFPGLVPDERRVAAEASLAQRDKDGAEIDQGLFLSHVMAEPDAGRHLCHAMLLPREESLEKLEWWLAHGHIDLGTAEAERRGAVATATMKNPRYLNAEDDTTCDCVETVVDLCLLDPDAEICVLRGARVDHAKYRGRRIFGTGINLTHLYQGRISYLWYVKREMGFINKLFRGLAVPDAPPDEATGDSIEKPWIAAVDGFAIGGGCQYLLACDYVLAAAGAYLTLPARKEGIVPGAANMRMWRFTGDRIARQAIQDERRIDCDSDAGRLICDEIVAPEDMDGAIARVAGRMANAGVVSAVSNRRALRIAQEPLDQFRRYLALYLREQAYCHFSPALIANLERNWLARRKSA